MSKFQAHKDAPDEVWLQIGYGDEGEHTWAPHEIAEDGIEEAGPYVRADRLSGRATVKPLEWAPGVYVITDDDNGPREGVARNLHAWRAGQYTIILQDSPGGLYLVRGLSDGIGQAVPTLTEAKAAAQADFEARILAALDTAPTPSPDQIRREALREAAKAPAKIQLTEDRAYKLGYVNGEDAFRKGWAEAVKAKNAAIRALITGGEAMTITTEEAEALASHIEKGLMTREIREALAALRALAAERDQMAKDLDAREIAHMAASVGIDSLTERLEKAEKARERAEAEAERLREALRAVVENASRGDATSYTLLAGVKIVARAALEGGDNARG